MDEALEESWIRLRNFSLTSGGAASDVPLYVGYSILKRFEHLFILSIASCSLPATTFQVKLIVLFVPENVWIGSMRPYTFSEVQSDSKLSSKVVTHALNMTLLFDGI